MTSFLGYLIKLLHILLILFVVFVPFITESVGILLLHIVTSLCLLTHWYTNNDTCCLTILEQMLLNKTDEQSFVKQLVNPIYIIDDSNIKAGTTYATISLLAISIIKFVNLYPTAIEKYGWIGIFSI